uniref:Bifunctional inhibitor/plant lipid transfer protein/seed storage helical domain-containing protein n=1 Tax=Oryza brachyantha TaxID=4533 RepID=J3MN59_ORYBR
MIAALTGCLGYIKPGSADAKPSKECCAGVKTALASPAAVACLCNALGQDFGIPVNYTRAAALPATCGGDSSALSKCNTPVPSSSGSGSGSTPATGTPSSTKSAATRSPVSATLILATIAATLLSYYYL